LYGALTGTVTIAGTAKVGETLTAVPALDGSGTIYYQWNRAETSNATVWTPITGADEETYDLTGDDQGKYITVTVTRAGYSGDQTSAAVGPVLAANVLTGTVTIDGVPLIHEILTANTAALDGSGAISYQWKRTNDPVAEGTNISSATTATYTVTADDEEMYIAVTVTRDGYTGSKTGVTAEAVQEAANTWTIKFNKNGGDTEATPNIKAAALSTDFNIDKLPVPPTKAGQLFLGWNTESDGSGKIFGTGYSVEDEDHDDFTVYAQWGAANRPAVSPR
jgi:uncharacterized repeat protein (TIGR02543 family)